MVEIYFVSADDCDDCKRIRSLLDKVVNDVDYDINIIDIDSEDDYAVDLALQYNLDSLPIIAAGTHGICGKQINIQQIQKVVECLIQNI